MKVGALSVNKPSAPSVQGETVVPAEYRPDALDYFCDQLIAGETVESICTHDAMPSVKVVRKWMSNDPGLRTRIVEAQKVRALEKTNEIFDIADDEEIPVASRRLRTDVRLKTAEKLIPDTYGKRIDHQLSVSDDFMQMLSAAKNVGHVLPDSDGAVLIEGEVID